MNWLPNQRHRPFSVAAHLDELRYPDAVNVWELELALFVARRAMRWLRGAL